MTSQEATEDARQSQGDSRDDLSREDLLTEGPGWELEDVQPGEVAWIPVSPVRTTGFRAVKVKVLQRASVGGYEEKHALDEWPIDGDDNE